MGTDVCVPPVPPPPVMMSGCGDPTILCGLVQAAEVPTQGLHSVVVELRDSATGQVERAVRTDSIGRYAFSGVTDKAFVRPVAQRTQAIQGEIKALAPGDRRDFLISFVPAILEVTTRGKGDFVLVSSFPIAGLPPAVRAGAPTLALSANSGADLKASLAVPPGFSLYLTCYAMNARHQYVNMGSSLMSATPASPQSAISAVCP